MNMSGFFISLEDYRGMDVALRAGLQEWLDGKKASSPEPSLTEPSNGGPDGNDEGAPPDLSFAQAKRLLEGCGDKTKATLRAVFSNSEPNFLLGEVAKEMKSEKGALGGAWAGITKRTRAVLGDKDAALFVWEWDDKQDDWIGAVSEMTHRSMRQALGIK
jgi:hypothetical protein